MNATLRRIGLVIIALSAAGCSSFDRRWQQAQRSPTKDPLAGAWQGQWISAQHGGVGDQLKCILTPVEGSGFDYRAEFKAKWLKVFTSEHAVVLHTERAKGGGTARKFHGSSRLSTWIGGGTYRCEGMLTPKTLQADYDSSYDRGKFVLTR